MAKNLSVSLKGKTVWVAGHRGMAGARCARRLARKSVRSADGDPGAICSIFRVRPPSKNGYRQKPAGRLYGGRHGRRHRRQFNPPAPNSSTKI